MPTYEYACKACGEHIDVFQSFSDDPLTECPSCGGELRKVFGNIAISFKGSGFYKNDSRAANGSRSSSGSSSGESSSSSSSDSSSDSSSGSSASSSDGGSSGSSGGSDGSSSSTSTSSPSPSPKKEAAATA